MTTRTGGMYSAPFDGIEGLWDDCIMPVTAINPTGPDGSMTVDTTTFIGSLVASATGTPSCFAIFQLPHRYKPGTDLSLHIHWIKNDATDNAGTVPWEAKWALSPIGVAIGSYAGYAAGTHLVDPGDVRYVHGITDWDISGATLGISSIICVVVRRNGGTSGVAQILGMDIHYQQGQHGSYNEASL
jgi:hypothetical protein